MRNLINQGIALAVTVGMTASMAVPAFAAAYHDIDSHWAKKDIEALTQNNVFEGYGDGTFRPNQFITRAEFVSVLMKALGLGNSRMNANYSDVPGDHWAAGLIGAADAKNLVDGYPDNQFRPTERITRAEALAILAKVTMGETPDNQRADMILNNYRDGQRIPDWSRNAVVKTIHNDVFKSAARNYNVVNPNQPLTRGETANLLFSLMRHNELARQQQIEIHHQWAKVVPDQNIQFPKGLDRSRTKSTYTATVATPISSEFNQPGDKVTLILNEKVVTPNGISLLPGTKVFGEVHEVRPANWQESAMMNIAFDRVLTPDGKSYNIQGTIATSDGYLHGNSNPAVNGGDSSYQALKAQIKSEAGAQTRHERQDVFYKNPFSVETSMNDFFDDNQNNFVLVGVGDRLELNFSGPANPQ